MPEYAILLFPAANRVYADSSRRLLRAELAAFAADALSAQVSGIAEAEIGGVGYVRFDTPDGTPLGGTDVAVLSNLSSIYALFELAEAPGAVGEGPLLRPVALRPLDRFDSDLLTIQKYSGKTNELFTKLLLNLTALATDDPLGMLHRPLRVLDPMCGRGTTLNQAMMYGFDAAGMEADGKALEAYEQFIKTWLRTKRVKHAATSGALRKDKVRLGRRLDIELGLSKEQYKAGDVRRLTFLNADTLAADELFKHGSFDLIVTDAPYGVQHGSQQRGGQQRGGHRPELSRSPRELLAAAVPVWTRLLRPGGALGLSWNSYVARRDDLVEILAGAGLRVRSEGPYEDFSHRVDQAIQRDLLIASKPA